jgi:hypothetical protein
MSKKKKKILGMITAIMVYKFITITLHVIFNSLIISTFSFLYLHHDFKIQFGIDPDHGLIRSIQVNKNINMHIIVLKLISSSV